MVAVKKGDVELLDLVRFAFELRQLKPISPPFEEGRFTCVDFQLPEIASSKQVDCRLRFQQTHLDQKNWLVETFPFLQVHGDGGAGSFGGAGQHDELMLIGKTQPYT